MNSRLRILLLTPEPPYPPLQGASLRNFYIIRGLAEKQELTLISAMSGSAGSAANHDLGPLVDLCSSIRLVPTPQRSHTERLVTILTSTSPDIALRRKNGVFQEALVEILGENNVHDPDGRSFDVVQIEGLEMAFAIPIVRQIAPRAKIVYDAHNAETELQLRALRTDLSDPRRWPGAAYSLIQSGRIRRYERWACQSVDRVTAVSEADRIKLTGITPGLNVTVIPNSIDLGDYNPDPGERRIASDIVFVGKMDFRPNVDAVLWFGRKIWPLIKKSRPQTTWYIVGQKPDQRLSTLEDDPNITITGFVDQVSPFLSGAKVVVLPFRMGSGTRLKLLEAMASGKAIVSTSLGAEGFPNIGHDAIMIVDESEMFAARVLDLLDSQEKRRKLGAAAREYAEDYDWRKIIPKFELLFESISSEMSPRNH